MQGGEDIGRDPIDPQDWATLWQSELAALAVDREIHEGLAGAATAWFAALERLGSARHDGPAGRPGADAPPRPPASGPAADPGGEPGASEPGG